MLSSCIYHARCAVPQPPVRNLPRSSLLTRGFVALPHTVLIRALVVWPPVEISNGHANHVEETINFNVKAASDGGSLENPRERERERDLRHEWWTHRTGPNPA